MFHSSSHHHAASKPCALCLQTYHQQHQAQGTAGGGGGARDVPRGDEQHTRGKRQRGRLGFGWGGERGSKLTQLQANEARRALINADRYPRRGFPWPSLRLRGRLWLCLPVLVCVGRRDVREKWESCVPQQGSKEGRQGKLKCSNASSWLACHKSNGIRERKRCH